MQGAPFNIKDFKVLLDAQVYEDLEGRWVDLFNRMKWDIIKSVLKSVAGLQGRKFKVTPCASFFLKSVGCLSIALRKDGNLALSLASSSLVRYKAGSC